MWLLRLRRFDRDVGLVLTAFILFIALENLAIGIGYRAEFVGTWEMGSARTYLSPIALSLCLPIAIAVVALDRLAVANRASAVAVVGGLAGLSLSIGVSTGRHLSSFVVRVPFVVFATMFGVVGSWILAKALPRTRPKLVMVVGLAVTAFAWLLDAFVLPRLYPAFHLGLFYIALGACGVSTRMFRRAPFAQPVALVAIVLAAFSVAWAPYAASRVANEDNLRRVLLEHAPILGRSVVLAAKMAPSAPLDQDETATTTLTNLRERKALHSLDWRGRDLILVTIDALRADHVSAYGYERTTTPNIDALAARGARFDHAYCPTPHTSYSIASMMTGKYIKPLLALDTEDDSETWGVQLRRYGYRTGAFYPPAVFFIDEHRFRAMHESAFGFEYVKEEFTRPDVRRAQLEHYLSKSAKDSPLFLWVHLFEPHEPYEMHADHPFSGNPRVDAYDSEVAEADAFVGEVVKLVEAHRPPGAVFIVSADHGEEHGEHGGRYHGTTVYDEQVRVPLVIAGPGITPRIVAPPVQTIDLLPTSLAALQIPVPPRLRGRDLGPAIAGTENAADEGLAFAETDDYTLLARGSDRLVCARKIGSCTLFDISTDRLEKQAVVNRPARVMELKKLTAAIERETGKLEASGLPDALRRGLQGDRDAAEDIAPLFDDARVDIRRATARCAFQLKAPELIPQLRRALARDEDGDVRQWSALALVRLGEGGGGAGSLVDSMLRSREPEQRTAAALALAERGDGRGETDLVARWTIAFAPGASDPGELTEGRELLAAFGKLRSRPAVPVLVRSLEDVRLRPHIVETLAEIGDVRAKEPLLRVFSEERYVHLRPLEARALWRLGARERFFQPLLRFAGTPEPMAEAIILAHDSKLLTPEHGGKEWVAASKGGKGREPPPQNVEARLRIPKPGPARLLVLGAGGAAGEGVLAGSINGVPLAGTAPIANNVFIVEIGELPSSEAHFSLTSPAGIVAVWLVPRVPEIPPPPPRAWARTVGTVDREGDAPGATTMTTGPLDGGL